MVALPPAPTLAELRPMLLCERKTIPRLPEAVSRSNNHGYRILARPGEPALRVRGGGDATSWFPEFHARIGGASRRLRDSKPLILLKRPNNR